MLELFDVYAFTKILHFYLDLCTPSSESARSGEITLADLVKNANDEVNGPFSSHLETLWFRLPKLPDIFKALKEILDKDECKDEKVRYRLEGAGLVRRVSRNGRNVQARYKPYETSLKERLRTYRSA